MELKMCSVWSEYTIKSINESILDLKNFKNLIGCKIYNKSKNEVLQWFFKICSMLYWTLDDENAKKVIQ